MRGAARTKALGRSGRTWRGTGPVLCLGLCAAFAIAPPAAAQDNDASVLQRTLPGGAGNTIFIDQSRAVGSQVGGPAHPADPATQIGGGNLATVVFGAAASGRAVVVQGDGDAADGAGPSDFSQVGTVAGGPAFGGTALLSIDGAGATGGIAQFGTGNDATVESRGAGASATILQRGDGNVGRVAVGGASASGRLNQIGSGSAFGLVVEGDGADVTYTIVGDGIRAAAPPSVFTNGGTVVVTQTPLGRPGG